MKLKYLFILLVVFSLFISGCGETVCNKPYILVGNDCCLDQNDNFICDNDENLNFSNGEEQTTNNLEENIDMEEEEENQKFSTKEPSEMVLELSDFPDGWEMGARAERAKSDVSEKGISLGWKKGYTIVFFKQNENNPLLVGGIVQYISIYPIENIDKTIPYESNGNVTYEELSDPDIGDKSEAYKVTSKNEFGQSTISYMIVFNKMDVHTHLHTSGDLQDYELLKELAEKAEKNIK